jgi:hypothetical protein
MKPLIAYLLVLFNLSLAEAQINLVSNPSFEDTVYCPFGLMQIDATVDWSSYGNSPDYFNGCNTFNAIGTPNTAFGYQNAHSGEAFVGLVTFRKYNSITGYNYREYVGIELTSPLQVGNTYYYSFYTVLAERNSGLASNNLGIKFLNNSYSEVNPVPMDNSSPLKIDSILSDSINWYKFSGVIYCRFQLPVYLYR